MNSYLVKACQKFDKNSVTKFQEPDAAEKFLRPIGLSLSEKIPHLYGDNTVPFSKEEEILHFKALHFAKYQLSCQLENGKILPQTESLFFAIRNRIISANMGIIFGCIQLFSSKINPVITHNQMLGEGHKSIIKTVDCFNPFKGYRFSTYACGSMLQEFSRLNNKAIRETSTDPTLDDMSGLMGNLIKHNDTQGLHLERLNYVLRDNKSGLTPNEIFIVSSRFYENKTYRQISESIGLPRHHLMKIQKSALSKLKQSLLVDVD